MLLCKRNICFILENFILLLSHFLVISTANIRKVVSMLFSQNWSNTMNKLNFHFQPNIKVERALTYRRWIKVILSMLFQRWKNVDKLTSGQLSFSTKFQRWNNVVLSTLNRCNSIDVVSTLFRARWNNVDKCTSAQLSFSTKYQRRNNVDERWRSTLFQRWINVDVFAGCKKAGAKLKCCGEYFFISIHLLHNWKFNKCRLIWMFSSAI